MRNSNCTVCRLPKEACLQQIQLQDRRSDRNEYDEFERIEKPLYFI
jgi:hypothetical protein